MIDLEPADRVMGSGDANAVVDVRRVGEEAAMTSAYDYRELHELIDRLEPEQAEELRRHALSLVRPAPSRFRMLRSFDGPATDLGARAHGCQSSRWPAQRAAADGGPPTGPA
ncbi:hypothetical protein [Streptomyces sp. TLI_185]|uniref:hypothetical protein n=1 Tax=Streptomyces sp. TLI_185 TaxID=2485151 RepID=UPI000F50F633|nr:hypothetical protein [Streptomyces sp. TLI_185]